MSNYYTVYRNSDDEVVAFGTAAECARMLGYTNKNSLYCMICRQKAGKVRKLTVVAEERWPRYIVRASSDGHIVAVGTARECTRKLGMNSISTFHDALARSRKGTNLRHRIERLPDPESEEIQ